MNPKPWMAKTVNKVVLLEVEQISPNPAQPRKTFGDAELKSLAESIATNGLLQPLTVRRNKSGYELVSGERRLRAMKYANLKEAPCIVIDTTDRQAAVLALIENIQRQDLNYFEEAAALKNLMVEWGISQQELGSRLGMAQPTIANKLRLLRFDGEQQKKLLEADVNERQARALLKLENQDLLQAALEVIGQNKLNVVQTEQYVDTLLSGPKEPEEKSRRRNCPIVKDVRLFLNTINNAINVMNQSGIRASAEKIEKTDHIEYIVRIPLTTG